MKRKVLVDGYNLLYQFPELRKRLERDLEGAREVLVSRLSSYAGEKNVEVVVVFDGDGRLEGASERNQNVKVIFSKLPEKADPVIKRLIDEKDRGIDLVVVSSDNEIGSYARLSGVQVVSSQRFVREIVGKSSGGVEKKYDHPMSQEELEEWMRLFGGEKDLEEESS